MKTILQYGLIVCIFFSQLAEVYAQSTSNNNNPLAGKFLGYNGPQDIDFRTNNISRMRLMQSGVNTVDGYTYNHDGFLFLSMDPTQINYRPFSLLHLNGTNNDNFGPQPFGYREWMTPGLTFTHNRDLMYVGPKSNGIDKTDAIIAWADNKEPGQIGPDVLRFLFLNSGLGNISISSNVFSDSDQDGVEIGRMTGYGHTGLGSYWTNTFMPHRTLDVIKQTNDPQFRITRQRSTNVLSGTHADFQVSSSGNLHVLPRVNGNRRTVAIGFLQGELSDPINNADFPTRLDVGGVTRIRDLPDYERMDCIVLGRNPGPNPEDNFLGRIDFPTGDDADCLVLNGEAEWINVCNQPGGADLDWEYNSNDVWTGHGLNGYPARNVGIGNVSPQAKLDVYTDVGSPSLPDLSTGVSIRNDSQLTGPSGFSKGLEVTLPGLSSVNTGVDSRIIGTTYNTFQTSGNFLVRAPGKFLYGVNALAVSVPSAQGQPTESYGVRGESQANPDMSAINSYGVAGFNSGSDFAFNYGVYGETPITNQGVGTTTNWAGYFNGDFFFSGSFIGPSDEQLKTDIQSIEGAATLLSALSPRQYYYAEGESSLHLPQGLQYGLIAQEVEEVLPELVVGFNSPQKFDSLGNTISESQIYKGVRYLDFIPLLISAYQTQLSTITEQQNLINDFQTQLDNQALQISEMQADLIAAIGALDMAKTNLDNCCQNKPVQGQAADEGDKVQLGQNIPNPFTDQTRIDFKLPEGAQVVLEISDSQGRKLDKLVDGYLGEGKHSVTWDGARYSPGMYYYSLFSNGTLLTKKMIKR